MTSDEQHAALLARALEARNAGRFDEARGYCREIFAFEPNSLNGLTFYFTSGKATADDPVLSHLRTLSAHPSLDPKTRSRLKFLEGKALDDIDDFTGAFDAFLSANANKGVTHDPEATRALATRMNAAVRARNRVSIEPKGPRMIFVLGMPRSGTSLMAQMLGRHPEIQSLGEQTALGRAIGSNSVEQLNFIETADQSMLSDARDGYLSEVGATGTGFYVDKMPENYWFSGIIPEIFPDAYIIHMKREKLGIAWSCFRHDFAHGHAYSYDFLSCLSQVETHRLLTAQAAERNAEHWHEIRLRDLASDPEGIIRSILNELMLPWDAACLSPKDGQSVSTLSTWQVRQGINPKLSDSWRKYLPLIHKSWDISAAH